MGHVILATTLWTRAKSVDLSSKTEITSCYMFIWKVRFGYKTPSLFKFIIYYQTPFTNIFLLACLSSAVLCRVLAVTFSEVTSEKEDKSHECASVFIQTKSMKLGRD